MNLGLYLADIKPIDGGVYQYSIYLLRMLLNCKQIDHITIFIRSQNENDFSDHFEKSRVTVIVCNESKVKDLLRQISDFWIARYYMREYPKKTFLAMHRFFNPDRKYFNSFDIDLLLVPKQHAPVYKLKYPVVITMHDLQHLHFPEFFSPLQRIQKSISYYISIEEADRIIVSYDHVKFDLEKYFCSAKEKINVCALPIDNDWITRDAIDIETLKQKFKLPDVFMLTPSSTWAHKNHVAVLEALYILKQDGFTVHWVATGHKTAFYKIIAQKIEQLGLQDQVVFPGLISDQELRGLYSMASLVIIPTKYEAGSGPLFEAIRYNIPVICSNVTSLPETIGDNDFVFNPDDYEEIAFKIKKALYDSDFILKSKSNGLKQLKFFSELNYSKAFIETFELAVTNQKDKKKIEWQKN